MLLDPRRNHFAGGQMPVLSGGWGTPMTPVRRSPYEESILRSLRRILRGIALYNKHLASLYDVTGPQLVCLRYLSLLGPTTPSRLAAATSLSKATITGIVDRLERRGLVSRDRSVTDKRKVNLQLTEKGKELVFTAPLPLQERFAHNLAVLPKSRQGEIDRTLHRIVQMMEVKDIDAAPILETADAMSEAVGTSREPATANLGGSREGGGRSARRRHQIR
jgi:DNA-binding MarR family transcriptional regulator